MTRNAEFPFNDPRIGLRALSNQRIQADEFRRKQTGVLLAIADLKRTWLRAGQPPYDERLKVLFPSDASCMMPQATGVEDHDTIEMGRLVLAMVREQSHSKEITKFWTFPEVRELAKKENLFKYFFDRSLSVPAQRSFFGRLLTTFSETLFQVGPRRVCFVARGKHRAKCYFLDLAR